MNEERVRIAPSPTGKFHIGSARTSLFNWLYARKVGGKFIVRIEDTDKARSKKEFEKDILDGLQWLELFWDEGPDKKGQFGPYRQSERLKIYQKYIKKLLGNGNAYYCYCTEEELEKERKGQLAQGKPPKYSGKCRNLTASQQEKLKKEGRAATIRFKVSGEKIIYKDLIRGKVEADTSLIGDFIIVKSDGMPVFSLAGVIDDFEMQISTVIRGEEHISNVPKQILLQKALNFSEPEYAHLPLILNPDRSKMSKRKDPVSLTDDFRAKGYLPEAMMNFLALLGWSSTSGKEIFSQRELINEFSLERVGKSPSIFDINRLNYLNGYYIRKLQIGDLAKRIYPFLSDKYKKGLDKEYYLKVVSLIQDRIKRLDEINDLVSFFFEKELEYPTQLIIEKSSDSETTKKLLKEALDELTESNFDYDDLDKRLRNLANRNKVKAGVILWAVRAAITGKKASPGVFEVLKVLGKEKSIACIKKAIDILQ